MNFRILTLLISLFATVSISVAMPDLLIVGAGISGLSAAAEGARLGLKVTVVDRNSLYGGTAVLAYGVAIVGSPLQEQQGIKDSPELAFRDFVDLGGDPDLGWVQYYVEHSKAELFDWFTSHGVQYEKLFKPNGNSVARFHLPRDGVVTLVQALYREFLAVPFEQGCADPLRVRTRGEGLGPGTGSFRRWSHRTPGSPVEL